MRILFPGRIKSLPDLLNWGICKNPVLFFRASGGFILIRSLITMIIILFCFSLACIAVAGFTRQSGRMTESTLHEINEQNAAVMRLIK